MNSRRKIASILIAFLFVLTSVVIVIAPQANLEAPQHNQSPPIKIQPLTAPGITEDGFSFPYTYQQPVVPKTVGVQGHAGALLSESQVGAHGQIGLTGPVGPVSPNILTTDQYGFKTNFTQTAATLTVNVKNGTLASSVPAVGAHVILQNVSLYTFQSGNTSSTGAITFNTYEGHYLLTITDPNSFINFTQILNINTASMTITRYLMPDANATTSIHNGGSSLVTVHFNALSNDGFYAQQVEVKLYNGSLTGTLLGSTVTNSLGTALFTNVNSTFTYGYNISGPEQTATGVYNDYGYDTGTFTPSTTATQYVNVSMNGMTTWTGTLTGVSGKGLTNLVSISNNAVITNAVVYFSAPFTPSKTLTIWVNNSIIFMNNTPTDSEEIIWNFNNTTIIQLSPYTAFGDFLSFNNNQHYENLYDSVFFGSTVNESVNQAEAKTLIGYNQGPTGTWFVGHSYNSIFESQYFQKLSDGQEATLAGTYTNDLFYNFNRQSEPGYNVNGVGPDGTFLNDNLQNSFFSMATVNMTYSVLNFSGSFTNTQGDYYNDIINLTKNPGFVNYDPGATAFLNFVTLNGGAPGQTEVTGKNLNISNSIMNATPKLVSLSNPSMSFNPTSANYYDDYFINFPNLTMRLDIQALETASYQGWGMTISNGIKYLNTSYVTFIGMEGMGFSSNSANFAWNFEHTNFSQGYADQEWLPFEWFTAVPTSGPLPIGRFGNDTFYGFSYNSKEWWRQYNLTTDNTIGYFQDLNKPSPPTTTWGLIYMNYSTIYNTGVGTNDGYAFGMSEGGILTSFNNNVFLNDPYTIYTKLGTTAWYNGSYMQYPISNDIEHAAGSLIMNNNWFLNLTNKTLPTASVIGSGGQGDVVSINLSNNHFFYYPNNLQTYIPTFTNPLNVPFDNKSKYNFPPGSAKPSHANYSYEIPMNANGKFIASLYENQYVFNSTYMQQNIYSLHGNSTYAYVIEPDVNTSTDYPIIYYYNGLVGGLQPNFTWNGSSYQLAVENNMTYITAPSTSASQIGLEFAVPAGTSTLKVWMHNPSTNSNTLITSVAEGSSASTVLVDYTPATEPLDPVFFTNTTSSSLPSTTSYTITFKETGLPSSTSWAVYVDGTKGTSTTSSMAFSGTNGSYYYYLPKVSNYVSYPASGTVKVNGANIVINVAYTLPPTTSVGPYSFGYQYSQPSIPSDVGAHNAGPLVPYSQIGITDSQIGLVSTVGDGWNGEPFTKTSSTVTVDVFNGTTTSSVDSVGTWVRLINVSTGVVINEHTSSTGSVSFTATEGHYILYAGVNSTSWINYTFEYNFKSTSETLDVYLIPSSNDAVAVSNGGSSVIWAKQHVNWASNEFMPQLEVELLNESASGAVLKTAYTGSNGSAEFTGLNTAYSYAVEAIGYSNPLSGMVYKMSNVTSATFTISTVYHYTGSDMYGVSSSTATLTGVTVPTSGPWTITTNAVINGGVTYLSSSLDFSVSASLTIENALVYVNESYNITGTETSLSITNSKIVFLGEAQNVLSNNTNTYTATVSGSTIVGLNVRAGFLRTQYTGFTMGFSNASSSVFYGIYSNKIGYLYGTFYNDLITNSSGFASTGSTYTLTNFTDVEIRNSLMSGGTAKIGTINMLRTILTNSSTNITDNALNVVQTDFNLTIPYIHLPTYGSGFGYISNKYDNFTHSLFIISNPNNVSWASFATNITPNRPNGAFPSTPLVGFSFEGSPGVTAVINFTESNLTRTYPNVNMNIQFGYYETTYLEMYNSYIDYNDTFSQVQAINASYGSNSPSNPFVGGRMSFTIEAVAYINYTSINGGTGQRIVVYGVNNIPDYFTHDVFPFTYDIQSYSYFRLFPSGSSATYYFENDSFKYIYWNTNWWKTAQDGAGFTYIWAETLANTKFTSGTKQTLYVNYNTFYAFGLGSGGNGIGGAVEFAERNVTGYVNNNLFLNSPSYILGSANNYNNYLLAPHADDILATASNVTIKNNVFLNLTNLSVPIGTDQAYQGGGNNGNVTASGNQFYYNPVIGGMTFINSSWAWSTGGEWGGLISFPGESGIASGSDIAYEIPMGYGTSFTMSNSVNGAYVFNSTQGQNATDSYMHNPQGGTTGTLAQWSWVVEPDYVYNGTSYVLQYNGMGGPQPVMVYNGYLYSYAVEQSYVWISTNSTSASKVPIYLSKSGISSGTTLTYGYYDPQTGTYTTLGTFTSSGTSASITVTYNPATMPLDPVFFLNSSTSSTPATYTVTFTETGLGSGITWYVNLSTGVDSGAITSTSYSFSLANGTYSFTVQTSDKIYSPSPYSGSFTVNGAPVSQSITFSLVTYTVTFTETGLPSGASWYVNLSSGAKSGAITGSSYSFSLTNSTYSYTVAISLVNYKANPQSGSFTVSGAPLSESVSFAIVQTYTVTFTETGLKTGTQWSIVFNSIQYFSSNSTIQITIKNGTYQYSVDTVNGYVSNPSSGTVTVSGSNVNVSITFSPSTPPPPPPNQTNNPQTPSINGLFLLILPLVIIAIAILVLVVIIKIFEDVIPGIKKKK